MRVIIPIRGPDYRELNEEYKRILEEFPFLGENNKLIQLIDYKEKYRNIGEIKFDVIYSSKFENNENDEIKDLAAKYSFFHYDLVSEFLIINLKLKRENSNPQDSFNLVDLIIKKLSLIIHLSYSTKIDFLQGVIITEEGIYIQDTEILISNLDFAYIHAVKIKWPKYISVPLNDTIDWFILNKFYTEGNSNNKLQRAINAFSYLFGRLFEKDTSHLFWMMLGIESLLAEGTNNILNQIKVKSTLILGEPKDYKKKLDKLYNYRSRLVHGDIDFPAKYSSDYEFFEMEYWDYLSFASSILLSLIRTLVIEKKNEFKFDYVLK